MKKLSFLILIAMAALVTQCKKENPHVWNNPNPNPGGGGNTSTYSINKGASVTMDALGIIQDEQGNPISGVTITLGSKTYTSNQDGQVKIHQAAAFQNLTYIKADKSGYFPGSRSLIPQPGVNHFVISLMEKGTPQVFKATTGGTLKQGNAEVSMGKSYVDASGNPYTGEIKAYVRHLDPKDPNLLTIMPGDLRGADANGENILETFGMLAVELEGSGGQKIQPAENHPATIKLTVPSSMLSYAPSTIPLWHFDEKNGVWSRDGEAKLVNGVYVGEVAHFSFWNCDTPMNFTELKATVRTDNDMVIPELYVEITRPNRDRRSAYINETGKFGGKIPAGEDLVINFIFENSILYSESFNPGNVAELVKDFVIPTPDFATVTGTVLGCNGSMLPDGIVVINQRSSVKITNGTYKFQTLRGPGKKAEITAIYLNGGQSQTRIIDVDQKNVNAAAIGLCPNNGNTTDYTFSFTLDGKSYVIEGVKTAEEQDSATVFLGGQAAVDFTTDHSFSAMFYKPGDWVTKTQFQIGPNSGAYNGHIYFQVGDGKQYNVKLLDINVLSKSPYSIEFSGTVQYYDQAQFKWIDVPLTNGKIIEN